MLCRKNREIPCSKGRGVSACHYAMWRMSMGGQCAMRRVDEKGACRDPSGGSRTMSRDHLSWARRFDEWSATIGERDERPSERWTWRRSADSRL